MVLWRIRSLINIAPDRDRLLVLAYAGSLVLFPKYRWMLRGVPEGPSDEIYVCPAVVPFRSVGRRASSVFLSPTGFLDWAQKDGRR